MTSNTCGKSCLVGCLILVGLGILMGIGCLVCGVSLTKGFWNAGRNISKISAYFDEKKNAGWEVDDSESNQPEGAGFKTESDVLMTWRARENPDDDWTVYTWEMRPVDEQAMQKVEQGNWQAILGEWIVVPRTQAALDVHHELNLPLPPNFELQPVGEEDRNADNGRQGKPSRDRGTAGNNNEENTSGGDEGDTQDDEGDQGNGGTSGGGGGRHGK